VRGTPEQTTPPPPVGRRWAVHAAVWAIVVLTWLLVLAPLLAMAALDFELVVVNQYEQDAATLDWLPLGRALVRWGPAPLLLAGLARALYTLAARRAGGERPALIGSRPLRWLLGALLLLPFAAAAVPLAIALTVWVVVEASTWAEWHLDVDPMAEWLFAVVPAAALLCLLWLGVRLVTSLWPRAAPEARREPSGLLGTGGRALVALPGLALLLVTAVLATAAAPQALRVVGADGRAAFEEHCGTCHFRAASLSYTKTPIEWEQTVERMRPKIPGLTSEEDSRRIATFLGRVRGVDADAAFRTRCQRCHGATHTRWEARPREQWAEIVRRRQRWSQDYYRGPVADLLVDRLDEHHGDEGATLGLEPHEWRQMRRLEQECAACHSISWNADEYRERDLEAAVGLVERMSQKMVDPLSPDEVREVAGAYKRAIDDPRRFDRLFPHDRPEPDPETERGAVFRDPNLRRGRY
jgi:hypothetical protein